MINGAWGGRHDSDGIEGITNPSQNMSNLPVETLEARYPIRVEYYGFRDDSGGAGEFRGGLGLTRTYRLLANEAVLQLRADRTDHPPYGLFGGLPGSPSQNFIEVDGTLKPLPGKVTLDIAAGTLIRHDQAAGRRLRRSVFAQPAKHPRGLGRRQGQQGKRRTITRGCLQGRRDRRACDRIAAAAPGNEP